MLILGILSVVGIVIISIWLERRKFYRTSSGGVQEYDGYKGLWKSRIIEVSAKIIRIILFLIGVTCFIQYFLGSA